VLSRQNAGLSKAANTVLGRVAAQVLPPNAVGLGKARQALGDGPCGPDALWFLIEVFRQIVHLPLEPVMQGVAFGVGRVT
jgi:hypothetical protein